MPSSMPSLGFKTRHFLLFLEESPNDRERRRDVEHNVFECYSLLYHNCNNESERNACVEAFRSHFPQSKYSFVSQNPSSLTPESFSLYLDGKLSQLHTLCSDIQVEKNRT